jgi:ribosome assembly protein YihI (activator of Der GTPase)
VTTLPTWAVYAVSIGTPVLAFVGVLIGHLFLRKGANELDVWRRREETMRMLRWASELAVSDDDAKARMGVAALAALSGSELLQEEDQQLVDAVLDSVLEEPLEEIEAAGDDVSVIEVDHEGEDWDSDEPRS